MKFVLSVLLLVGVQIYKDSIAMADISSQKTICELYKNNINVNFTGAFIFHDRLFLLTSDWDVYELPIFNLEYSFQKLLMNESSQKIETKWQTFKLNTRFDQEKSSISVIFSFANIKKPQLLFMPSTVDATGFLFDMTTKALYDRYENKNFPVKSAMISNEKNDMYSLNVNENNSHISLQMYEVEYHPNGEVNKFAPTELFIYPYVNQKMDKITMFQNALEKEEIPKGFTEFKGGRMCGYIWNNTFHLFSNKDIYIFSKEAVTNMHSVHNLTVITKKDYFVCSVTASKNGTIIGIVIACVLVLLMVLLCVILRIRVINEHRRKHKHGKNMQAATTRSMLSAFFFGDDPDVASVNWSKYSKASSIPTTRSTDMNCKEPKALSAAQTSAAGTSAVPSAMLTTRSADLNSSVSKRSSKASSMVPSAMLTTRSGDLNSNVSKGGSKASSAVPSTMLTTRSSNKPSSVGKLSAANSTSHSKLSHMGKDTSMSRSRMSVKNLHKN